MPRLPGLRSRQGGAAHEGAPACPCGSGRPLPVQQGRLHTRAHHSGPHHLLAGGGPPAWHHRPGVCGRLFHRLGQPVWRAGVQFTSAVWQGLCQSLGMAHHQTSAYHLQANGLVERFPRQLKDALRARLCGASSVGPGGTPDCPQGGLGGVISGAGAWHPAGPSWPIPGHAGLAAAGPRTGPAAVAGRLRQPTHAATARGAVGLLLSAPAGGLPTRPLRGEQLGSYCPPQLLKAELVYIKVGASKPPLQPLYEGPYRVIWAGQKVFVVDIGGHPQSVTVDRLKPHLGAASAVPAAPPRRGRPPVSRMSPQQSSLLPERGEAG